MSPLAVVRLSLMGCTGSTPPWRIRDRADEQAVPRCLLRSARLPRVRAPLPRNDYGTAHARSPADDRGGAPQNIGTCNPLILRMMSL